MKNPCYDWAFLIFASGTARTVFFLEALILSVAIRCHEVANSRECMQSKNQSVVCLVRCLWELIEVLRLYPCHRKNTFTAFRRRENEIKSSRGCFRHWRYSRARQGGRLCCHDKRSRFRGMGHSSGKLGLMDSFRPPSVNAERAGLPCAGGK